MKKQTVPQAERSVTISLSDFTLEQICDYLELCHNKVVLSVDDLESSRPSIRDIKVTHPSDYIDTKDALREHLVQILGLGHYVSNQEIVSRVSEILEV